MPEYRRKKQHSGIKKPRNKLFRGIGWGIGIRTPTNRVRVCRATVTQFPNIKLRTGFLSPASQYYTHSQSLCQPFFKNFSHGMKVFYFSFDEAAEKR